MKNTTNLKEIECKITYCKMNCVAKAKWNRIRVNCENDRYIYTEKMGGE